MFKYKYLFTLTIVYGCSVANILPSPIHFVFWITLGGKTSNESFSAKKNLTLADMDNSEKLWEELKPSRIANHTLKHDFEINLEKRNKSVFL